MAYVPNSGSVAAWLQSDNASVITVGQGSIAAVIVGGSVAASFTPPANQSVSGTVNLGLGTTTIGSVVLAGGVNAIGSVAALQGTNPWQTAVGGSVITVFQDSSVIARVTGSVVSVPVGSTISYVQNSVATVIIGGSVASGTQYLENAITTSVTGTAVMFRSNANTSIVSVVSPSTPLPVSVQGTVTVGGSVFATLSGLGSVITVLQSSSLIGVVTGSVVAISQGSVITVNQSSSIIAVVTGSVTSAGAQSSSNYGMRSDALSSFLGVDKTIRPIVTDDVGRTLTKPFAGEQASIISYVGSTVSGSVQLIAASIAGQRAYITDFWLSNTGATTTLVTFQDGTTSLMGQFIAPAGGGMSSPGLNIPLKAVSSVASDVAFKVSPSTSVLYVMVKGYYAP